ncbi:MAG: hypothetical protein PHF63_05290 [Herbinix sp.]|nr:hypothetical protein [Herbinix sp.]
MFLITLSETVRVILILLFFFLIIPMIFMKSSDRELPFLDRFFFMFICSILFMILSVHILVLLKLFDVISICVFIVLAIIVLIKFDKNREMGISKLLSKLYLFYDAMDTKNYREAFFNNVKRSSINVFKRNSERLRKWLKTPIFSLTVFVVLILSVSVRMFHSIVHYAYPHLDMYLHLKWIKAIMSNNLYLDNKIYPKAMHSVIALISKITFSDSYWILRYFGPFCAVLLVIAIYFLAFKITGNKYLSVLAMAIYGLTVNNNILPSVVFRQTATMPQEFGMLFIVLGFAFLIEYIKTLSIRNLFSFEACLLIGLMSHSFSGAFLIFWTAVTVIFSLIFRKFKLKAAVKLVGISAAVVAVSFLPLVLGMLLGKVFHETSLEMVTDVTGIKILELSYKKYIYSLLFPDSFIMYILIFGCIGLLITLIFKRLRYQITDINIYTTLLAITSILYIAYNIPNLIDAEKLPELLKKERTGPFLSLLLPITAAIFIFYAIDRLLLIFKSINQAVRNNIKGFVSTSTIIAFIAFSLVTGSYSLNTYYKHVEYDQAAEAYIKIKSEFTKNTNGTGNWYVVATDPQLAQITGYGWYEEGYNFAQDYTKEQVMDPDFKFPFPVNNIFIFVEKKPIIYNKSITLEFGEKK